MRIVMYIVGSLLLIASALAGYSLQVNGMRDHLLSAYLFTAALFLGGALITLAAAKHYRGGVWFLLGIVAVVFAIPCASLILGDYFAGTLNIRGSLSGIGFTVGLGIAAPILLILGHKRHLRLPTTPTPITTTYIFRDLAGLRKLLTYALIGYGIMCGVAMASNITQYQLLTDFHNQVYTSREQALADANANDDRQAVVIKTKMGVSIMMALAFLVWTHRAASNAHTLNSNSMSYTPRLAVLWYFVPFANIWHPYQAMKEIWQVSHSPMNFKAVSTGYVLPLWWLTHLASNALFWGARQGLVADSRELEKLAAGTMAAVGGDLFAIGWAIAVYILVRRIYQAQMILIRD